MAGCLPYTQEEINLILKSFSGKYRLRNLVLFYLGLTTGFRIYELLSLKVVDLVYPDGRLRDRVKVSRCNMKGGTYSRSTPLLDIVRPHLMNLILSSSVQGQEYLFTSRQGGKLDESQGWRILRKASHSAGVWDTGTHRMRKTFALRIYKATGKNIYETQKALGHKSIDSTTSYLSFDREELEEKVKGLFV